MDGARISNAAASLGLPLRAFTRDVGVDVLSFGGTKNGAMLGEAIVVLDPEASAGLTFLRKLNMQLSSKMRFVSAQLIALLEGDLWLRNASHSNAMAAAPARRRRGRHRRRLDPAASRSRQPTQANGVFATLPDGVADRLRESFRFYDWDAAKNEVRWMCRFDTTEADIDAFVAAIARETAHPRPERVAASVGARPGRVAGSDGARRSAVIRARPRRRVAYTGDGWRRRARAQRRAPTLARARRMRVPLPPSISAARASDAASAGGIQVTSSASWRGSHVPVTGTTKASDTACWRSSWKARQARHREVLGDGERHRLRREKREGHGAEIVLEVAEERVAHGLAVAHAAAHDRAGHGAERRRPQQDADLDDRADAVGAHRDGLDVEDRHPAARLGELDIAEPAGIGGAGRRGRAERAVAQRVAAPPERGADAAERIAGRPVVVALVGVGIRGADRHVSCIPRHAAHNSCAPWHFASIARRSRCSPAAPLNRRSLELSAALRRQTRTAPQGPRGG